MYTKTFLKGTKWNIWKEKHNSVLRKKNKYNTAQNMSSCYVDFQEKYTSSIQRTSRNLDHWFVCKSATPNLNHCPIPIVLKCATSSEKKGSFITYTP